VVSAPTGSALKAATGSGVPVRLIEQLGSQLSRGFVGLLHLTVSRPLRHDTDIAALRRRYETFDARHVRVDASVPAEWISVPETRPDRTLLLLHGGSFAFRFPNTYAAFAARLCRHFQARAMVPDYRMIPEHRVVHALESIQVDEQQHNVAAMTSSAFDRPMQMGRNQQAIR